MKKTEVNFIMTMYKSPTERCETDFGETNDQVS